MNIVDSLTQQRSADRPRAEFVPPRRQVERGRVIRRAQIVFELASVDAVVLDWSPRGAGLRLTVPAQLPPAFVLRTDGTGYNAVLRWAHEDRLGVEFFGEIADTEKTARSIGVNEVIPLIETLRGKAVGDILEPLARHDHLGSEHIRVAARDVAMSIDRLKQAVLDARNVNARG